MSVPDQPDDFILTRESLLGRLKNWDDQESWREFFDLYGKLIYGLALKCGLNDAEAQDVVQETLLATAKKMPGFKYAPAVGSFKGWLLQITRRRIADHFRKRPPEQSGQEVGFGAPTASRSHSAAASTGHSKARTATVERVPNPGSSQLEQFWEQEWQQNLLEAAMGRVKRQVTAKQYQMFHLYVAQQWPMHLVTSTLGVSAAQVYMAKMRISRMLKSQVRELEKKMI